jgi:hypothetical protein
MRFASIVLALCLATVAASAQDAPALTDVQKLQVQNLLQSIEIAQLKAIAAQRDFDVAKETLLKLAASLQRDGYDLDLQALRYTPKPAQKAP